PRAHARAVRALRTLLPLAEQIELHCCAGEMGAAAACEAGFAAQVLPLDVPLRTAAEHTVAAARALADLPVDLLLFAGGDGTARDVCSVIGTRIPALGIPAGVKMHSGVYAVSPEAAGQIVQQLVRRSLVRVTRAEVRDLDEDAFRAGRVSSRHFGELLVPEESRYVQHVKEGGATPDAQRLTDIAAEVLEELEPGELSILGPGTTTFALKQALGIDGVLLGVDVCRDGVQLARDAGERKLLDLLDAHKGPVRIVVTVIGGQGHVFGRGNQQISARVIRAVGIDNITIVAAPVKIAALAGRPLLVDTNDVELDRELQRYLRVIIGYREAILYPVGYGPTPADSR
ncbi:MAG TPA: ATP-NAD kinase family protein, partial [Pseudomonadales bacterium]|nr:ATP-NAD kinase family protein [Pseudomonadales bacterium]